MILSIAKSQRHSMAWLCATAELFLQVALLSQRGHAMLRVCQ